MVEIMHTVWIAIAAVVCILHIASALTHNKTEKTLSYIALFLHIPLFAALLLAKEKIEIVALVVTISLFVYIVANALVSFFKGKNRGDDNSDAVSSEGEDNV